MKMTRNRKGTVVINDAKGNTLTASIPENYSALGIMGTNGIINNAVYKEDGYVYVNGKRKCKWHIMCDQVRVWEPRFQNLSDLYRIWKKTKIASQAQWKKTWDVVLKLWGNGKKKEVYAHVFPRHYAGTDTRNWWVYKIHKYNNLGPSFSFDWVAKPEKLSNPKLGQELYDLEQRSDTVSKRHHKADNIFKAAMKKSLPKATEWKVLSLQFEDTYFYFYTVQNNNYWYWEMFREEYKFENKKIV